MNIEPQVILRSEDGQSFITLCRHEESIYMDLVGPDIPVVGMKLDDARHLARSIFDLCRKGSP